MAAKPVWLLTCAGATLLISVMAAALPQSAPGFSARVAAIDPLQPTQFRRSGDAITAEDLTGILSAQGYRAVSPPRLKGGFYVVEAVGRRGQRATLVVDIWTGEISGLRRSRD
jgi:hypothetical protein